MTQTLMACFLILSFSARAEESKPMPSTPPQTPTAVTSSNPILKEEKKFDALEDQDNMRILRHKPIYFAFSNPLTKIQFSFRSPIVEDVRFYFAYTQLIFWKLQEESKPFLDATYNPEFFYRFLGNKDNFRSLDVGIWEHNSNGKATESSRSYDSAYLKGHFAFDFPRWVISFSTKLSYIYNNDDTNRDILNFQGPLELQFRFTQLFPSLVDKAEFSLSARPGGAFGERWDMGGYEAAVSFRLGGIKVVPSFYLQYFRGYGETLLTYNVRDERVRFGFMF